MEKYTTERLESYTPETTDAGISYKKELETKMAELAKIKEEISKARESAIQSWLDSKPIIDQLEMLQLDLKNAKNQACIVTIRELEQQLETTNASIRSKKNEKLKFMIRIDEMGRSVERTPEIETMKSETDKERRARAKLKQELRLRRQTLRTLQLTLRAVRIESEALGASAADALDYVKRSDADDDHTVQLTHEEYNAVVKKANEETALAEWRVSMSTEQRYAAEASREKAVKRLKELYTRNRSRKRDACMRKITEQREQEREDEAEQGEPRTRGLAQGNQRRTSWRENMSSAVDHEPAQRLRRAKRNHKKKKSSILQKIKTFLVRNITRLFG